MPSCSCSDAVDTTTENAPVPDNGTRPSTMLADGFVIVSKSPNRAASVMKAPVVSYDAFKKGDVLLDRPVRLNGL